MTQRTTEDAQRNTERNRKSKIVSFAENFYLKRHFMDFDNKGIALGSSPEDLKNRKIFITDFYVSWVAANPTKRIYNISLENFIEVRFLSIQETASKAAIRYKSTLSVTYLTEILENAVIIGKPQEPKKDNVKQKRFSKIYIMGYEKEDFGKIKLTVGELRGSGQKIQYCITAIENDH